MVDENTKKLHISALMSAYDHPNDKPMEALTQDQLTLGNDAHLKSAVTATGETKETSTIYQSRIFLSRTDFKIGDRMQVETIQTGEPGVSDKNTSKETEVFGVDAELNLTNGV